MDLSLTEYSLFLQLIIMVLLLIVLMKLILKYTIDFNRNKYKHYTVIAISWFIIIMYAIALYNNIYYE